MKTHVCVAILFIGGAAALSLTAQEKQAAGDLKHVAAIREGGSRPVSLSALAIERDAHYPGVIRLKGRVEIRTPNCLRSGANNATVCEGETVVHADEAEFSEYTGEIQAHGNVQITPPLPRE